MRVSRREDAFDSDQHIFELKVDGFRALAHVEHGQCQLVSRNGHRFGGFSRLELAIGRYLPVEDAILDGEIACLDERGRPTFRDLLLRRRECVFIAFDLPYLNGKDLRILPLIQRKSMLKDMLRAKRSRVIYLDHVDGEGELLFEQIVAMDLEGIVCKLKDSPYRATNKPSRHWITIPNSHYSQRSAQLKMSDSW